MIAVVRSNDAERQTPIKEQMPSLYIDCESRSAAYLNLIIARAPQKIIETNDTVNSQSKSVSISVFSMSTMPAQMRNSPNIPMMIESATFPYVQREVTQAN